MILEIKTFPDDILRQKAEPVVNIDDKILKLLDDMAETMYSASGYGLAAPQIGQSLRIIVLDETAGREGNQIIEAINPEILENTGEILEEEGCLSIPGEYAFVKRCLNTKVKYTDRFGSEHIIDATERLARIFQHEIDHLNGKLFIDKLPIFKKETIKKNIRKRIQTGDYAPTGK